VSSGIEGTAFFSVVDSSLVSKRDIAWNVMFKRLQDFKYTTGHCNVPQGYTTDLGTCDRSSIRLVNERSMLINLLLLTKNLLRG
jgi:hypothetical protein